MSDVLGEAKRKTYALAHAVTLPTLAVVWGARADADAFVRWGYPALAGFLVWTLYGLLSGRVPLPRLERSLFGFVSCWGLVYLAHTLYGVADPVSARQEVAEGLFPVLAALCVLSHMFFAPRVAGRLCALLIASAAVVGLPKVASGVGDPRWLPVVVALLRMEAFVAALAAWLYAIALVKDRLAEETAASGTDALTGLLNRRGLYRAFDGEAERARRYGSALAVILFDLDHFKQINDRHGHAAGDRVLRMVGEEVRRALRPADCVGRWGGEEFVVLLPQTVLAGAVEVAERLRYLVSGLRSEAGPLSASFGVAEWVPTDNLGTLVRRADGALYKAKQAGRNRVVAATEGAA